MKPWQRELQKFLKPLRSKPFVEGAVVTGSYVFDQATKFSDIDVHIVLKEGTPWRERGNKVVDGFLIEYFMNPPSQIRKYFKIDFASNMRTDASNFALGTIVFDKHGVVVNLQDEARAHMHKRFDSLPVWRIELLKYGLWDHLDGLKDAYHRKACHFAFFYHILLREVMDTYAVFLRAERLRPAKLDRYLTDHDWLKSYSAGDFPDQKFLRDIHKALEVTSEKAQLKSAESIVAYVHKKMGGFEIDGWKLRGPVE